MASFKLTVPPLVRLNSVTSARTPAVSPSAVAMALDAGGWGAMEAGAAGAVVAGGVVLTDAVPVAAAGAGEAAGAGSCLVQASASTALASSRDDAGRIRFIAPPV